MNDCEEGASRAKSETSGQPPPDAEGRRQRSRYQASPEEQAEFAKKLGSELVVMPFVGRARTA